MNSNELRLKRKPPLRAVNEKSKPQNKKSAKRPLRDLMDSELYTKLLSKERQPKQSLLHYYRFQLYIILARHTGLRVGDIGRLTYEQVTSLSNTGRLDLQEKKNGKFRKMVLSDNGKAELQKFQPAVDYVFSKQSTLMGTVHSRNWVRFINTSLIKGSEGTNLYIRSHSSRVTYVTHLLKKFPIVAVSQHINHSSVVVTEKYNRYTLDNDELVLHLNKL